MPLLQSTASLPRDSGQCNSYNTLPHCLGEVGSETRAIHCFTTRGLGGGEEEEEERLPWSHVR